MKLSIIILNHNTKDLTLNCIKSIRTSISHEIIVVDNGSADDSVSAFTKLHHIHLVTSDQNIGFAAGNNLGLKKAQGEYLLLLNSDTEIADDALDKCINYLNRHPQVGILTPQLVLADGAIDLACHRGLPTPLNSFTYFSKLSQLFPNSPALAGYHQTWKDFSKTHPVDAVSGASMFIRRKVIDHIGYLDERFFMYAEDLDFCARAKAQGWQIIYFPQAKVLHLKGSSGTKHPHPQTRSRTKDHFYHTMKQYFSKHYTHYPKPIIYFIHRGIDLIGKIKS